MMHRYPKMIIDGKLHMVDCVITSIQKKDLKSGDAVQYQAARKLGGAPKPAIVVYVDECEIHLMSPDKYAHVTINRIDCHPEVPTHEVMEAQIARTIQDRKARRSRRVRA
jgi:hypothetical protein